MLLFLERAEVRLYWDGAAPPGAERYARVLQERLGGPLLIALFPNAGLWRVCQVPLGSEGDLREEVRAILKQAGLPVE